MIHDYKDYNERAENRHKILDKKITSTRKWIIYFSLAITIDITIRIYQLMH